MRYYECIHPCGLIQSVIADVLRVIVHKSSEMLVQTLDINGIIV